MATDDRTREALLAEIAELRYRLDEAEETLRAIGSGEVDALVVSGSEGEQVFTLKGAEQPYRVLVESMNEGAATLAADGTILYCNNCLSAMLQVPLERLIGTRLDTYAAPADRPILAARLESCTLDCSRQEIALIDGEGTPMPVLFSCFDSDLSSGGGISVVITDLRQQKRNEEIIASERLARSIIEQAGEAIIVCDEDGRVIRASRLAYQLCGRNPLLKPFDELFHLLISETDCLFSVVTPLHGGCFESVEVELKQADDEVSHLLLNATPLINDLNRIIGCVVSLADISERKKAEEALAVAHAEVVNDNNRLEAVMKALPVGLAILDAQGGNVSCNSTFEQIWGGPCEPVSVIDDYAAYQAWWADTGQQVQPHEWASARAVRHGDTVVDQEMEIQRFDGMRAFVLNSAAPIRDAEGRISGCAVAIMDITARKQVDEALKKLNQELESRVAERTEQLAATIVNLQVEIAEREKAEERALRLNRLYAVLSETNQAIVRTRDRDTLFSDFCRIAVQDGNFKLAWVGLVDEECGELKVVAAAGATGYLEDIRITVNGEPTGSGPTGMSILEGAYYICNDFLGDPITRPWHERGRAHGFRASASVALKQEGVVVGALTLYADKEDFFDTQQVELLRQMGADVSFALDNIVREARGREAQRALQEETAERRKLEQQLRQSQKLESIGLLAGGVAHDFNNLLTGIGGYAQLIQDCADPDHELQECVTQLMSGVDRAAELTRSLLAFSRKQELNRQPAMIDGIIDKAGKFIRRVIGEDIEFRTVFGVNDLLVLVDIGQIEQVLLNLAINARDAMPHGGCLTISVSRTVVKEGAQLMYDLPSPGNYARVSVADTGAGIDRTTMERIFEPFYTTKAVGKGTGLGLSIVHGIIKQHDGSILVSSESERGATFDIYLPLVEGREFQEERKMPTPVAGGTETLLLAEDEEIVKTLLKRTLENAGYRVMVAADGNEALALFGENDDIALVISDVVMPGKNGKEIFTEIREITPGMKFIFISGYTADIIRERGMGEVEMEAEIISKPFSKNDLLRKVRELLDRD